MIQGCEELRIRRQIQTLINKGWSPTLEFREAKTKPAGGWLHWRLPAFSGKDADVVFDQVKACRGAHRQHHIRLVGFDAVQRTKGGGLVIFEGDPR